MVVYVLNVRKLFLTLVVEIEDFGTRCSKSVFCLAQIEIAFSFVQVQFRD